MHREAVTALTSAVASQDKAASLEQPVYIRYRKRRFQGAKLRALSSDELEVTVQALTLPPGTQVELEFLHSGRQWRLPAQVARRREGGLGLRLDVPQPELLRGVHQAHELPPSQADRS